MQREVEAARVQHAGWTRRIDQDGLRRHPGRPGADEDRAPGGGSLFNDNCAACHGANGAGGPGFPDLIARRLAVGRRRPTRSPRPCASGSIRPVPRRGSRRCSPSATACSTGRQILDVVAYVQSLGGATEPPARGRGRRRARRRGLRRATASTCHGADAKGSHEFGAPNLTDQTWIYGGDGQSIYTSVYSGRQGQMPTWEDRLSTDRAQDPDPLRPVASEGRRMTADEPCRPRPRRPRRGRVLVIALVAGGLRRSSPRPTPT